MPIQTRLFTTTIKYYNMEIINHLYVTVLGILALLIVNRILEKVRQRYRRPGN